MILISHIFIALASIVLASSAFFRPSRTLFYMTYASIVLTFGTGVYLIVSSPAHMLQACASGIAYLVVVSFVTGKAKAKFARMQTVR